MLRDTRKSEVDRGRESVVFKHSKLAQRPKVAALLLAAGRRSVVVVLVVGRLESTVPAPARQGTTPARLATIRRGVVPVVGQL